MTTADMITILAIVSAIAYVTLMVSILFHETGHYGTARMLGVRPRRVEYGSGPILFRWRDSSRCWWYVRSFPMAGQVRLGNVNKKLNSMSAFRFIGMRFLIVLGGPVSELAWAAILFWMSYATSTGSTEVTPAIFGLAAKVAICGCIANLIFGLDGIKLIGFPATALYLLLKRGKVELEWTSNGAEFRHINKPKPSV